MWSALLLSSGCGLALLWVLAFVLPGSALRRLLAYLFPVLVVGACIVFGSQMIPSARLLLSGLVLLYAFKGASLLLMPVEEVRGMNRLGLLWFSSVWPGIDPAPFVAAPVGPIEDGRRFGAGMARVIVGVLGFLLTAGFMVALGPLVASWMGIACLLLIFHLGVTDCLTEVTRAIGFPVKPLFESPFRSSSLSNFWSQRWNRPFVEMNRIFFLPVLVRRLGMRGAIFVVFLISGILHELAISYPVGAGWGMPLAFFALQGLLVLAERRLKVRGPVWVALVVLAPVPILFHGAFRAELILPFLIWVHGLMAWLGAIRFLSLLVWALGIAQVCILAASLQVPSRLRWKEELPRLSPLNHKLMWTYGSFIVYTILSFGVLTLVLHDDILHGTRAGLAISFVMFVWWGLRLGTDLFYFESSDWPEGRFMQIGHVMLNCLFTFVFCGYGCVLAWGLLGRYLV